MDMSIRAFKFIRSGDELWCWAAANRAGWSRAPWRCWGGVGGESDMPGGLDDGT